MESTSTSLLISELKRGLEVTKQLRVQLGASSSPAASCSSSSLAAETNEILVQQIVSSYENALQMLKCTGQPSVQAPSAPVSAPSMPAVLPIVNSGGIPESPASIDGSPRSDEFLDGAIKDYSYGSKKRKMLPRWTEQVRTSPERGLEGPQDDGYSWRKYGQKDILGAKYPRSYYRCTYRNTQNCWATKQVQRSDGDPTVFEVTYRGTHSCLQSQVIPPPPSSPEKHDTKPTKHDGDYHYHHQNHFLDDLRSNLTVQTEGLDAVDVFSFPAATSSFYSCQTTGGNNNNDFGSGGGFCHVVCSEPSDFPGLMSSTNTSTGSSPMFDVDFPVEIDTGFPFDNPMFFT